MPAECTYGVMMRNKPGGTPINYELPGYYRSKYQLIVRAVDDTAAETLMKAVLESLTVSETVIDTLDIRFMRPMTRPAMFTLSKGNLLELACDMEAVYVDE